MPKRFGIVNNCSSPIASERGNLCESFWGMVHSIRDKSLFQNKENFDVVKITRFKKMHKIVGVEDLPYTSSNIHSHLAIAKPYGENYTWLSVLTSQKIQDEKMRKTGVFVDYISGIPYSEVLKKNDTGLTSEALEALVDSLIATGQIKLGLGGQGLTMPQLISNEYFACRRMLFEEIRQYLLLKHVDLSGYCSYSNVCQDALKYHQDLFEKLKFVEEIRSKNLPGGSEVSLILDEIKEKRDVFSSCNSMLEKYNMLKKN